MREDEKTYHTNLRGIYRNLRSVSAKIRDRPTEHIPVIKSHSPHKAIIKSRVSFCYNIRSPITCYFFHITGAVTNAFILIRDYDLTPKIRTRRGYTNSVKTNPKASDYTNCCNVAVNVKALKVGLA